jgi:hypothetical protein
MQMENMKSVAMAAWVLAVGVLAYILDPASLIGWTFLAVMAAIPPLVMMRLWRVPQQSTSESIREALR